MYANNIIKFVLQFAVSFQKFKIIKRELTPQFDIIRKFRKENLLYQSMISNIHITNLTTYLYN